MEPALLARPCFLIGTLINLLLTRRLPILLTTRRRLWRPNLSILGIDTKQGSSRDIPFHGKKYGRRKQFSSSSSDEITCIMFAGFSPHSLMALELHSQSHSSVLSDLIFIPVSTAFSARHYEKTMTNIIPHSIRLSLAVLDKPTLSGAPV